MQANAIITDCDGECEPQDAIVELAAEMATAKEDIRKMLETLPDDATWEDVQHSIYVRERVERGRREAEEGKFLEQDEVERRMEQWLE